MRDSREHALRIEAIRLHENGIGFNIIKRRVQRSDSWLTKWLRRYWEFGEEGLLDQSRAPIHIPNRTRDSIIGRLRSGWMNQPPATAQRPARTWRKIASNSAGSSSSAHW